MRNNILLLILAVLSTYRTYAQCDPGQASFGGASITAIKNVTCFSGNDGEITVELNTTAPGEPPYRYELIVDFGGGGVAPYTNSGTTTATSYTFTGLPAERATGGNYEIIVSTSNTSVAGTPELDRLCSTRRITDIDLTQPDSLKNEVKLMTPTCNGNYGAILLETTGGTGTYLYNWTIPAGQSPIDPSENNPTGLIPGNYTVEITDDAGCPLGGPIVKTITIAAAPVVADQTPAVCEDAQGTGQASGLDLTALEPAINSEAGTTTTWYNDLALTSPVVDPTNATATNGQEFFAQVDNGSCQSVATVTYTVNPYPADPSNLQATNVGCNGFTANWDASSDAVAYVVEVIDVVGGTTAASQTVTNNDPIVFSTLSTYTEYQFTVLARNVCGESSLITAASVTTDGIPPVPTGLGSDNVVCDGFEAVWDAVANATDYTVEVFSEAGLNNREAIQTVAASAAPTGRVTFSGLSRGTTYYFHVRAENDCDDSPYSPAASVTTGDVPPDPANVALRNPGCTSIDATWDAVPGATQYIIEFIEVDPTSSFDTPDRTETITDPLATSFTFNGLTADTQYQFRIRAENVCGESNRVVSAVSSTNPGPTAPTGLTAADIDCNNFEAQWTAVGDADSYTLEVYQDAGLTVLHSSQSVTAPTATVGGLTIGTTYYYRVNATGDCGSSPFTAAQNVTTDNVPTTPSNPQPTNVGCTTFEAGWTASANADSYIVEVIDVDAGDDFNAPTFTQTVTAPTTTASFTGLTANTQYQFRVRATNTCGESGNVTSAAFGTAAEPGVPTGLTAIKPGCTGFGAQWNAVTGANDYLIEVYDDAGLTSLVATQTVTHPTANATFTTLAAGTNYFFRVQAQNTTCGNSSFTAAETVATDAPPTAPSVPTVSNITCTTLDASWTPPASEVDDYILELINVSAGSTFATPDRSETVPHPTTTFTFSGLTPNTQYQLRVRARNTCGESDNNTSNVVATNTLPTANDQTPTVCEDSPGNGATVDLTALEAAVDEGANHSISWFEDAALAAPVADPTNVTANDSDEFFAQVDDGTCQAVATVTYTVNSTPDATFSYASGTFCQDAGIQSPTVATGGGTFNADPGLAINSTTGDIDVSASALGGPYTVTYNLSGACSSSATFEVTITDAPDATFGYSAAAYCQDAGNQAPVFGAGASGGTFSANPASLAIDASSGVIDPANSTPGIYIVTNTIAANGSCPATSDDVAVEIVEQDDASFTYNADYCQNEPNPTAIITGTGGGTFSAPAGLVFLDNSTGEIDLVTSTPDTYTIRYTTTGTCPAFSDFEVTINSVADATFSYASATYCPSEGTTAPDAITTPGGTFSASTGLIFNDASTGEINLAGSTPGNYTVTYATGGTCSASATFDITVEAAPTANDQAPAVCEATPNSGQTTVDLTALETAIDGGAGHTITWFEDAALTTAVADPANVTTNDGDDFFARVDNGTCQDVATVVYTVNNVPVVNDRTPSVCEDTEGSGTATVDLTALETVIGGGVGYTYAWFEDTSLTVPVADPTSATVSTGEDFFAQASDGTCSNTATVTYDVQASPTISFSGLTSPYCATDGSVVLTGSANPDGSFTGPGVTDNGNGTASFDPATAGAGTHTVVYQYTDGTGCANQSSQTVVVNNCTGPVTPNFVADVTTVCENGTVEFRDASSGAVTTYDWNFGAGATPATATGPGPHLVTYSTIGAASVSLTVDGPTTETKTDYITISGPDDAGFNYAATEYCPDGTDPSPSVNVPGGTFSASAGLVINASTGEVDLSVSTAGATYAITYTTNGTCPASSTFDLTIQDFGNPDFNYASSSYCQNESNPVATITGDTGGTFSAPTGLVFVDDATGEIDLLGSAPGNYDVTYTTAGTCPAGQDFTVTIVGSQSAAFGYASGTFCTDGTDPQPEPGYAEGGTFSTTDPVVVDPDNGTIDLSASPVGGPYTVTYTIGSGACLSTESVQVSITNTTADPTFSYGATEYCTQAGGTVGPTYGPGASAGEFSYTTSGAGTLALTTDGTINLENSTPGTYRIVNLIGGAGGSCSDVSHEEVVQIFAPDVADVTYGGPFCQSNTTDPVPTINGTENGVFSSTDPGITLVPSTGLIDLSDTDPGVYDITYTTTGPCSDAVTVSVTVEAATDASFSYAASEFCKGNSTTESPNPGFATPGSFSVNVPGLAIDATSGDIDVDGSDAGTYLVTYETTQPDVCNGRETVAITINEAVADAGDDAIACALTHQLAGNDPGAGTGAWTVASKPAGAADPAFANRFAADTEVTVDQAGAYEFVWTVTQGICSASDDVVIDFNDRIEFIIGTGSASDCGTSDGQITILPDPPTPAGRFTFNWYDGQPGQPHQVAGIYNGEKRDNLPSGTDTVQVIDNVTGCTRLLVFSIGSQTFDSVIKAEGSDVCSNESGQVRVFSQSATDTRQYEITYYDENYAEVATRTYDTNTETEVLLPGLSAGDYNLEIEVISGPDAGCTFGNIAYVEEFPAISVQLNRIDQASCVGPSDGNVLIDVDANGTTIATYVWKESGVVLSGQTNEDLNGVPVGNYTVDITYEDGSGGTCTQTFGPYNVTPQATSPAPTADDPVATSIQCSSFDARWLDEGSGISYLLDVSEDESFTDPLFLEDQAVNADQTTFTVSGLTSGTDYWYRVRAVDGSGCISEYSNIIAVTTVDGIAPGGLYVTNPSCNEFTAHWSPVIDATGYAVEVATDPAFTNLVPNFDPASVPDTDRELLITGLDGGQTYYFRVGAQSSCGTAYSSTESVTTDGLSGAPTDLTADATCREVTINWQAVSGAVSRYDVYLDDDDDFTNGTLSADPDATTTGTSVSIDQLTSGRDYFYHVLAVLGGCDTEVASSFFRTEDLPATPTVTPSAPTCDGFTLTWAEDANADAYLVEVSNDGFATSVSSTVTTTTVTLTDLAPGTTYAYRVTARGCEDSAPANGTAITEDASGGLASAPTASNPACNGFTVSWDAVPGAIGYTVQASSDGFATNEELMVRNTDTTFNSLMIATTYEYRVAVRYDCGTSGFTAGASTITTSPEADCGCGFDKATFVVDPVNENCLGSRDGALLINLLPNVSTTPTRFRYRYNSLTNPADSSADWETGADGTGLVWATSTLPSGDYRVRIQDTNAQADCEPVQSFNVTIATQNSIVATARAETCETPGEITVTLPSPDACAQVYGIDIVDNSFEVIDSGGGRTFTGVPSGNYRVVISDFFNGAFTDTLAVFVPTTCTSGPDTTVTVCNLNGITFLPETTLAECEDGQGSVTFISVNDTEEVFTFTVVREGGVVFETQKDGTSGITFEDLPAGRYTYGIYDALLQSCQGRFTVGAKSVSFTAAPAAEILCDDLVTPINVAIDTAATLAAGPYEVFLIDQTDTLAQTTLLLGTYATSFADVPVGGQYEVAVRPAAQDACQVTRTVNTNPPGTTALQFTYQLDSATCFQTRGSGSVTISNIVVDDNKPFDVHLYRVDLGEAVEYASRRFSTTPQSVFFDDIENGEYQIRLQQAQGSCATATQEKRSDTFVVDGPTSKLTASVRSFVEVTVNYPYGTIEIDSIGNYVDRDLKKEGAPYQVRIAADPAGDTTGWVTVANDNPLVRPYRHEYLDRPVGTYFVEVRDRFGCVEQYTVEVGYTSDLYIPNIFTPNDDGQNDTFYLLNLENYGENSGVRMKITNRWGNVIYQSDNYTNVDAWDGDDYPDGVYFYHLILPGNVEHTGWVEIWRGQTP